MGNILSGKNQAEQALSGSSQKTSSIDDSQPFGDDLPELFGPDPDGFYYHQRDKAKVDQGIQYHIEFKFKYNAIDYDPANNNNINNNNNNDMKYNDDDDDDDDDEDDINKKYKKCRYEWVYIAKDNIPFHRIKEPTYFHPKRQKNESMPEQYEKIRKYLVENDPIPPYFLRRSKMADMVFQQVLKSSLCEVNKLKCRIATRCIGEKAKIKIFHPALLMWDKNEVFGKYDDKPVMLIHLTKLPEEYKDDTERKLNCDRIEIQCRPISKYQLDRDEWNYEYIEQDLELEHGLLDIAHWCLKYEMDINYQYSKYIKNCRRFMVHLCQAFKIKHDASQWTDTVVVLVETIQRKTKEYKSWSD